MNSSQFNIDKIETEIQAPTASAGYQLEGTASLGSIARGAGLLVTSDSLQQVLVALTGFIIVRSTDAMGYGHYSTAIAFAMAFGGLFIMGLEAIITREIAQSPWSASSALSAALALVMSWSPMVLALGWGISKLMKYPRETETLLALMLILAWGAAFISLARGALRGFNRMGLDGLTRVVQGLTGLVFVCIALLSVRTMLSVTVALLAAMLVTLLGSIMLLGRFVRRLHIPDGSLVLRFLRASFPLGLALVIQGLYWRLGILALSRLASVRDVGLYSSAFNTVMLSYGVSLAIISSAFPTLSALARGNKTGFKQLFEKGLRYVLIVSLPIGVTMSILAPQILVALYGFEYREAAGALSVLGFLAPLMFVRVFLWGSLVALGKQNHLVLASSMGAAAVLAVSLYLVPYSGIVGSAIAAVVGESCVVAVVGYYVWQELGGIRIARIFPSPMVATGLLAVCIWVLGSHLGLWLSVPVGVIIYAILLVCTMAIRPNEVSWVVSALSRAFSRIQVRQ
jgi:O-antigen/teichoic acid export membrane protein